MAQCPSTRSIPEAVEAYRKMLGIEPAKVRHAYAKFELEDPPVIFSLNVGGEPRTLSHLGVRYAGTGEVASDKFWIKDADGIPWEMHTLLADVEAETAADSQLRSFLGQQTSEPARA